MTFIERTQKQEDINNLMMMIQQKKDQLYLQSNSNYEYQITKHEIESLEDQLEILKQELLDIGETTL